MSKKDDQNYIFSLLNDIPEKLSDYQTTPLTNEEMFKYRESLRQNIKKTKSSRKKGTVLWRYISMGAAACLLITLTLFDLQPRSEQIRASSGTNHYSLSSMLGVSSELEDYAQHINENHSISGGSVTLNSAALDSGRFSIYSTYYYDEMQEIPRLTNGGWGRAYGSTFSDTEAILYKPEYRNSSSSPNNAEYVVSRQIPYIQRLFVNGEEMICETESDLYASANGVLQDTAAYFFSAKDIEFPARITVEIWKDPSQKAPETTFDFILKKENIVPDKKNIELHHTAVLPDGRTLTFKRFVYNTLGIWVEAEYEGTASDGEKYGSSYLQNTDENDNFQILREHKLNNNRLLFSPDYITSLYSQIDAMELLEYSITMYHYDDSSDTARRIVLDEPLKIPLK
ncbi:MAG: hypothetical protein HFH04_02675 [Dorea sp.]|nr:hypothetical protein [Dorea sp.]